MNLPHACEEGTAEPVQDFALRAAVEQIRLLAAQSKLLALNAAFEAAGAAAPDAVGLAAEAGRAAAEADCIGSAAATLLEQIAAASAYRPH